MEMMLIHADETLTELGVLQEVTAADLQISQKQGAALIDNTFSFTVPEAVWETDPIREGHYLYIPQTEYGGLVTYLKHSTADRSVTVQGQCWRGMLFQKAIYPPSGSAYLVLSGVDANTAIDTLIGDRFGAWVDVSSETCGVNVSGQYRYETVAAGIHRTLRAYGLRLRVRFDNVSGKLKLAAESVSDLTDVIEISQDYGVDFTSETGNVELSNHCLALGSGELTARTVLNLYYYDGAYYTARPNALPETAVRTTVLDYPNAEDLDELTKAAKERLTDKLATRGITVDELSVDVSAELGDTIGVRDRLTGMTATAEITEKILTIRDGRMEISVKVA